MHAGAGNLTDEGRLQGDTCVTCSSCRLCSFYILRNNLSFQGCLSKIVVLGYRIDNLELPGPPGLGEPRLHMKLRVTLDRAVLPRDGK